MTVTRREFLRAAGSATLVSFAGCDAAKNVLGMHPTYVDPGPYQVAQGDTVDEVTQVLRRLSYGPRPGDYARVSVMGADAYIQEQLAPEAIADDACDRMVRRLETLRVPVGELYEYKDWLLLDELARGTTLRAIYSKRQLFEVMVGFWTDHFNIASSKGDCPWLITADNRDVIRRHALGRFRDLLGASALSPAMLWYLDGRVNRKAHNGDKPNENYARELMELHTMGVNSGYTQQDVMEVARCLTGWTVRTHSFIGKGRVDFNPKLHDDGAKTVLGHHIPEGQGAKDMDSVLDIVAFHPATARHIATKLCQRFVSYNPAPQCVNTVATAFTDSEGSIKETLSALFNVDTFWNSRDTKFKRPFRFAVSALRATGADTDGGKGVQEYLARMGQSLFQYPTPDGYPDRAEPWLGTLLWRWHFVAAQVEDRIPKTRTPWEKIAYELGGQEAMMRHLLGRRPTAEEAKACLASGLGAAFLLATPGFQRY